MATGMRDGREFVLILRDRLALDIDFKTPGQALRTRVLCWMRLGAAIVVLIRRLQDSLALTCMGVMCQVVRACGAPAGSTGTCCVGRGRVFQ